MAGNARFELASANHESNFVGNYPNGQRGYSAPTLGRSASFRENTESRMFNSVKVNSRGGTATSGDVPMLSQCLMLEPINLGDQKQARASDLRRVLSFSMGNGSEDNSFAASHPKTSPPGAVEEIKRLRANVADTCFKASGRAKKLDEHINKLNRFFEAASSKKQQRNESLMNERPSGSSLKIGSQMHRNLPELGSQKLDGQPKSVGLNKRPRTSIADNRAESRNNTVVRQPLLMTKERDMIKDNNNTESDIAEEKIRRLPAGGEGWDKKMKRKRSVGAVFSRSVDNDLKRTMHHKFNSESSMQSNDSTHGFRSGASGFNNKLESTIPSAGSNIRTTSKIEQDISIVSRDLSTGPVKERTLGKVNVRLNNRDENHSVCPPSPVVKGKASRAPRNGPAVAVNLAANNIPRVSATLESWEQPPVGNRILPISGPNNRKRTSPVGSASPPITQWGGQRPHKISRTRRTNLIPVSSHEEVQMHSEEGSPSDFGARLGTGGANASVLSKNALDGNKNLKVTFENVPSPVRFSESEESGAGENIKEKSGDVEESDTHVGQNTVLSSIPMKKNKIMFKEEIGDGVRRQGRNGRVSPFSRVSISPTRDKLDNVVPTKPLRNARSGSDKNGSKSGRPLKKLSDRKGFSRLGLMANGGSPDCSGESEDDREELLEAANLAWNFSCNACSSASWKTVEALFASIGPDEKSFLLEQLKLSEESCAVASQSSTRGNNIQDNYGCKENEIGYKDSLGQIEHVERHNPSQPGSLDAVRRYEIVTPLYQRVLSALIVEDEIHESEETGFGRIGSSINEKMDICQPIFGAQAQKIGNGHISFSCNGNTDFGRSPNSQDYPRNGEFLQKDGGYIHSEMEILVRLSRCDYAPQGLETNNFSVSAYNYQYQQMSLEEKLIVELQSLDLFMEPVPALDDKEDEWINQEIAQLETGLHQQILKKKTSLDKIHKALEDGKNVEIRNPEQVAVDRLAELALKKLLATKGSLASKHRMAKVSRPAAMSFMKRTLARCRKFDESGTSCFSEPPLHDIIYAAPRLLDETELLTGTNLAITNDSFENPAFAKSGSILNRGKRREVLLDDVGGVVFRASSTLGIVGGAKGKRSERDTSTRNAKVGRPTVGGGSKGERKPKSKPKQRTAQLSTTANGFIKEGTGSGSGESVVNKRKDVRFMSSNNTPTTVSNKVEDDSMDLADLPLNEIDAIGELGVDTEMGAPQDLTSWFNFEVDGLQDHDSVGLEIPMDDLSELQMF